MSSARSRRLEKSGNTRSMPSMSAVGNISPVSTITIRPSASIAVMFLPISPSPPRGTIRTLPLLKLRGAPGQQTVCLECPPDLRPLLLVGLDDREPGTSRADAEQLQTGLDGNRVGLAEHLVDRAQRCIDLARPLDLAALHGVVDLPDFRPDQVRGDQDPSRPAHLEGPQEGRIVARQQA